MSFSAAMILMLDEYEELLGRAERAFAFGVFLGEIGSLPFSVWGIAEEDKLTTVVAIWCILRPVTAAPCMHSRDVETGA